MPKKQRQVAASSSSRLTLDFITKAARRVEPDGLVVEDYSPRLMRYTGSKAQIKDAGVLPATFCGWPATSARWQDGSRDYCLTKKHASGAAQAGSDLSADYWQFDAFDDDYSFKDHLNRCTS